MRYIFLLLISLTFLNAMEVVELTNDNTLNAFFSIFFNLMFLILPLIAVLSLLTI